MQLPPVEAVTSETEARELAVNWQHWQASQSASWGDVAQWNAYFAQLAEQFGLTEEFQENGIL